MNHAPCFASASLDTNILIHLWRSQTEEMLRQMFSKVYVHQWLLDTELPHHADMALRGKIIDSMDDGFLVPVDNAMLKEQGLYPKFKWELENLAMFFSHGDTGEGFVIALAKVYGIPAVVTNDIKTDGPKWYLNIRAREPFGFSSDEVLLINYLKGAISEDEYLTQFQAMNEVNGLNWRIKVCVNRFAQRFLGKIDREIPASVRDHQWIADFAQEFHLDVAERLAKLRAYIPAEEESVVSQAPKTRQELLLSDYPLSCSMEKRAVQESYRRAYQFMEKTKESLNVPVDAVIACVLEQLGYNQSEIVDTMDALSPMAENRILYSKLAFMKRNEYDKFEKIQACCDYVKQALEV